MLLAAPDNTPDPELPLFSGGCVHSSTSCLLCNDLVRSGNLRADRSLELEDEVKTDVFAAHRYVEHGLKPYGDQSLPFETFVSHVETGSIGEPRITKKAGRSGAKRQGEGGSLFQQW
jgi:hypothetical protein